MTNETSCTSRRVGRPLGFDDPSAIGLVAGLLGQRAEHLVGLRPTGDGDQQPDGDEVGERVVEVVGELAERRPRPAARRTTGRTGRARAVGARPGRCRRWPRSPRSADPPPGARRARSPPTRPTPRRGPRRDPRRAHAPASGPRPSRRAPRPRRRRAASRTGRTPPARRAAPTSGGPSATVRRATDVDGVYRRPDHTNATPPTKAAAATATISWLVVTGAPCGCDPHRWSWCTIDRNAP